MRHLRLGLASWTSLVERLVAAACAAAPRLEPSACRELVELILLVRIRAISGETCDWLDPDPPALPAMFAASAADRARVRADERDAVEARLATAFRTVLGDVVID
jgi:hypothetical protein